MTVLLVVLALTMVGCGGRGVLVSTVIFTDYSQAQNWVILPKDAANAFDYYLAHYNKDKTGTARPFILAAHSQGSNLLLYLLQRKFNDPALRKLLVAAYVIGWSITSDDMSSYPDSLQLLGICAAEVETGCVVTYNTQQTPGDWSQVPDGSRGKMELVKKNAYSVNPLTWTATGPGAIEPAAAPATANLGAVFHKDYCPGPLKGF